MAREHIEPSCEIEDTLSGRREIYKHPAYITVNMTVVSGGRDALFGSDVPHSDRIRIEVKRAELVRNLSTDWYHPRGVPLIEFDMSHAQFAQFITTQNRGVGVPATLTFLKEEGMVPGIKKVESKNDLFKREIRAAAAQRIEDIGAQVDALGALIESGKLPKKELQSIHKNLDRLRAQLPNSLSFVVGCAEEALEEATLSAKIEVESFISSRISELGLKTAQNLGLVSPQDSPNIADSSIAELTVKDNV